MRFPEPVRYPTAARVRDVRVPAMSRGTVDGGCQTRGAAQLQGAAHPHLETCFCRVLAWQCSADSTKLRVMIRETEARGVLGRAGAAHTQELLSWVSFHPSQSAQ